MGLKSKKFKDWTISYFNEVELNEMLKELYEKKYYQFDTSKPDPVIFDVGALIGETVLYFKERFPRAKITAFEPSPRSFSLLKKNISRNRVTGVRLLNLAVGKVAGKMDFYIDKNENVPWGRGDSLKNTKFTNPSISKTVKVQVVRLSKYINANVDLLKLDVEGAETEIVCEIEKKLKFVKNIILEFHESVYNPENKFSIVIGVLKKNGFRISIYLGKWPLPEIAVILARVVLKLVSIDEYWLRIYAKN